MAQPLNALSGPALWGLDDELSLLDPPPNGLGSSRLAISANTVHGPHPTSIVVKSGARGPVMLARLAEFEGIVPIQVQIFSRKRS